MRTILPTALVGTLLAAGIRAAPGGLWLQEAFDLETGEAFADRAELDLAFARGVLGEDSPFIASPLFSRFPRFAAPTLSAGRARSGRWAMRFLIRGEAMRAEFDSRSRRAAVPGAMCVVRAWVRAQDAKAACVQLGIEWLREEEIAGPGEDPALACIATQRGEIVSLAGTEDWQPIRCQAQAPAGAISFLPFIEVRPEDPEARGGAIFVDDIEIRWVPTLSIASSPSSRFLVEGEPIRWRVSSSPLPPEILRAPVRTSGAQGGEAEVPDPLRRVWREEVGERDVNRRSVTLRLIGADGEEGARLSLAGSGVPEADLEWEGVFPAAPLPAGLYSVVAELRTKRGGEEPEIALSAGVLWQAPEADGAGANRMLLACAWPEDLPIPWEAARMLPGPILGDLRAPDAAPPAWARGPAATTAWRLPVEALRDPRRCAIAARSPLVAIRGPMPTEEELAPLAGVPVILHERDPRTLVPVRGAREARILEDSFRGREGAGRLARTIAECAAAGVDVVILRDPEALIERCAAGVGPRPTFLAWSAIGGALAAGASGSLPLDTRGTFLRVARGGAEEIVAWAIGPPFPLRRVAPAGLRVIDAIGRISQLAARDGAVEFMVGPEPIVLGGLRSGRDATLATIRVAGPLQPHGRWQRIAFEIENRGGEPMALRAEAHAPAAEIRLERSEICLGPGERGRFEGKIRLAPLAEGPIPVALDVEIPGEAGRMRVELTAALSSPPFEIDGPEWTGEGESPFGAVRIRNRALERIRATVHISIDGSTVLRSAGRSMGPGELCVLTFRVPERSDTGPGEIRIGVTREGDSAFATKVAAWPGPPKSRATP